MSKPQFHEPFGFQLRIYGVSLSFDCAQAEPIEYLKSALLLPGWLPLPLPDEQTALFNLVNDNGVFRACRGDQWRASELDLHLVLESVVAEAHRYLAEHAEMLFIHSGVVGLQGGIVLFPGRSYAGKSTLTKALVDASATFYSDEYCIIDPATGLVHSFPRRLSLRYPEPRMVSLTELRWLETPPPLPLRAVFCLRFQKEEKWSVQSLSPGETLLALFNNCVAAQSLGPKALAILTNACQNATGWRGVRGEAAEAVEFIRQMAARIGCPLIADR